MTKTSNGHSPLTLQQFQKILMPQISKMIVLNGKSIKNDLLEKIKHLPTKKQYYAREDKTMGELQKLREEVALTGQHYKDTNKRVDKIDNFLKIDTLTQK